MDESEWLDEDSFIYACEGQSNQTDKDDEVQIGGGKMRE